LPTFYVVSTIMFIQHLAMFFYLRFYLIIVLVLYPCELLCNARVVLLLFSMSILVCSLSNFLLNEHDDDDDDGICAPFARQCSRL